MKWNIFWGTGNIKITFILNFERKKCGKNQQDPLSLLKVCHLAYAKFFNREEDPVKIGNICIKFEEKKF